MEVTCGQQLSHHAIFIHGCHVHKARSNQPALSIQPCLYNVQYGEVQYRRQLYSASVRKHYWWNTKYLIKKPTVPPPQYIKPTNWVVLGVELVKTVESVAVLWE